MQGSLRAGLTGAAIAALATLPGLGSGTLWDNSETAYGEVAREIWLARDWIVLHFNGAPWFVQPPLYFWVAAICAKIFGLNSFALRFPSALATIAMGGMTAYAVARQAGARAGVYAGLILSTCLMQAIVGRLAIMDALLDLTVAASIFWWFRAIQSGRDRYFIYGCVAAALGFLAKGPVAPVAALLVMIPYYLWDRRVAHSRPPSLRACLAGLALFVIIAAPWLAALASRAGVGSVAELVGHYTFGRYTGTIENQSGPIWYYLPVLILGFFPWIAFFPSALAFAIDLLRKPAATVPERALHQLARLALVWIALPFVFFSLARTKLPNYIALELPAFALLVAIYFDGVVERLRNRSALVSTAAVPLTIALLAIAIVWFSHDNRLTTQLAVGAASLVWVGAAIFAGSLAAFVSLLSRRSAAVGPPILAVAMVLAVGFLALLVLPNAERFKPIPHLAHFIQTHRRAGDAVAIQNFSGGNALIFYTRPVVYVLASPQSSGSDDGMNPRSVICRVPRVWVVAPRASQTSSYGRDRKVMARWGAANLLLYSGRSCT